MVDSSNEGIRTDRQIAGLRASGDRIAVRIAGARGLWVRASPSGLKVFELRYVSPGGKNRRLRLGEYPSMSLADAIKKAGAVRNDVVDGGDPAGDLATKRQAARTGDTLDDVFDEYVAAARIGLHGGRKKPKKERTLASETGLYNGHVKPKLGERKALEISRTDIRVFMTNLASKSGLSAPSVARIGEILSSVFGFLVHTDRREDNPVARLAHPLSLKGTSRDRRFSDNSLKKLWTTLCAVDNAATGPAKDEVSQLAVETSLSLRFAVLTLCRRGEVAGARWAEINQKDRFWEIPANRTKSGRPHVVPLSEGAVTILKAAVQRKDRSDEFIFPAPKDPKHHIDECRLTRAVKRLCDKLEIPQGSPHDFRRTGATTLTGHLGFSRFTVGCVLGHQVRDGATVTAIYDRYDYLPEKRRALEAWGSFVTALAAGRQVEANVLKFPTENTGA
jgi:integrase